MELCVHVKCSTKEQHAKLVNLCSEQGFYIDLEQSWSSWVAETRVQEPSVQADGRPPCECKGTRGFTEVKNIGQIGPVNVSLSCISPEARDLLDTIMDHWEKHHSGLKEMFPDKEITFYGFAYWLVRHSGLIQPAPNPAVQATARAGAVLNNEET